MTSKALILVDFENEWVDKESDYFVGDFTFKDLKATREEIEFLDLDDFVG